MSGYILTKLPSTVSSIVLGHNWTKPFIILHLNIHVEIISRDFSFTFSMNILCNTEFIQQSHEINQGLWINVCNLHVLQECNSLPKLFNCRFRSTLIELKSGRPFISFDLKVARHLLGFIETKNSKRDLINDLTPSCRLSL